MDDRTAGVATLATPASGDVPARADGVELLGELDGSGYREAPCLARRADGQTIQLTDLLYKVLEAIDGRRDDEAVAAELSRRIGKQASAEDVRFLVDEKLRPLGLVTLADGSQPEVHKANPLLALRLRVVISNERTTRRLTAPFARLFHPPLVIAVVAGFAALVGWLLFGEGVGGGTRQVLYSPGLVVMMFVLASASAGFHEFGHAAACRYSGGRPGVMGAGIYLVWPAFYTDVTDSYRLSRRGRLRTDLGGLYFNMVFALGVFGVWFLTHFDALLVVIPLLLLQMVQQLLPFVRLDGYHILADLTGVPDLFARIKPTLASLKPGGETDARVAALKPWVRVVVTLWVLAVVPLLLMSLLVAVINLPRVAATAWDSFNLQRQALAAALGRTDVLGVAAGVLSLLALGLPLLSSVYLLGRLATRTSRGLWSRTEGRPGARGAVTLAGAALVGLAAFVWWPNGDYRPLQPGERGRLQDTVASIRDLPGGRPGLTEKRQGELGGAPFRSETAGLPAPWADPGADSDQPANPSAPAGSTATTVTTLTVGEKPTPSSTATTATTAPPSTTTTGRATTTTTTGATTTVTTAPATTGTTVPTTTESTSP